MGLWGYGVTLSRSFKIGTINGKGLFGTEANANIGSVGNCGSTYSLAN